MTVNPEIQAMGPKERFERVVDAVKEMKRANEALDLLHYTSDRFDIELDAAGEAMSALVNDLEILMDTGITEQISDCLSVIYGQ